MDNRPIGIFDSGVGGLTVVKEILKTLPDERIIYLGDTARVPYGTKSCKTIKRFALQNVNFLMQMKVKLIVVACNTASSISIHFLKKRFRVPIIGVIKPGVEKAVAVTRNGRIGVIATYATIKARAYENEIKKLSHNKKVFSQSCPLFVPLVEEGWLDGRVTYGVAKVYLASLVKERIDTLILGCTHYPLLKGVISRVMGEGVQIVDSASSVAEEVAFLLKKRRLLRSSLLRAPAHKFFVTDAVEQFVRVGERFLGMKINNVRRVHYV